MAEVAELLHLAALQRNVGGESGDSVKLTVDFLRSPIVGFQIMHVTGVEIASLTGFSIHEQRFQALCLEQYLLAVLNHGVVPVHPLKRQESHIAVDGQNDQEKNNPQPE